MARNTSKNQEMQQHPEMMKAGAKARPIRRAIVGGGWSQRGVERPFAMTDSPAGAGEIVGRALQWNEHGHNILPEDAVLVCVFRQYAKIEMKGPCKHVIFSRSELTPFDESLYATDQKGENDELQTASGEEKVQGDGGGKDGAESPQ